eukprot:gnl/TRDRNA2_/TRDRNA2_147638_c1_seq1.p1 gnl/TRDRNA2_/TRDRNA2_147638_c1~~gnl/TRDRNA2_/TRDRNA2_147638_c1_seq1.p1  ORF type:complete len:406 (-),score=67.10 gnl/TRDRNA2_/TRDRNA2_147638_c1_seq1:76-1293(-)
MYKELVYLDADTRTAGPGLDDFFAPLKYYDLAGVFEGFPFIVPDTCAAEGGGPQPPPRAVAHELSIIHGWEVNTGAFAIRGGQHGMKLLEAWREEYLAHIDWYSSVLSFEQQALMQVLERGPWRILPMPPHYNFRQPTLWPFQTQRGQKAEHLPPMNAPLSPILVHFKKDLMGHWTSDTCRAVEQIADASHRLRMDCASSCRSMRSNADGRDRCWRGTQLPHTAASALLDDCEWDLVLAAPWPRDPQVVAEAAARAAKAVVSPQELYMALHTAVLTYASLGAPSSTEEAKVFSRVRSAVATAVHTFLTSRMAMQSPSSRQWLALSLALVARWELLLEVDALDVDHAAGQVRLLKYALAFVTGGGVDDVDPTLRDVAADVAEILKVSKTAQHSEAVRNAAAAVLAR